ncbi:MAG: hypothetical protein NZ899_03320 [Thermoguttaceae bacterium]|nr:hypothetical protein [Thermoguttaceae bacterium]MDW8078854.1 hypothetical protein [Thermoguttaceae bacterium]
MCEHCNRREFLEVSGLGSLLLTSFTGSYVWAQESPPRKREKAKICVIFAGNPGPADRGWNMDAQQMETARSCLEEIQQRLGNVELVIGQSRGPEETTALLERTGPGCPVLILNMHIGALLRMIEPVLKGGHPTVVFSLPASGHDWMYPPRWQREGHPMTLLASSDWSELERAIRLLRVIPLLQQTRILLFPPARGTPPACSPEQVKARLGAEVVAVQHERFDEMLTKVDEGLVQAEAERWTKNAKAIIEPTQEDILKAARVSIALQQLMEEEQADALAVGTCMGWLSRGFPCLGFTRLRDKGLPAACEGDMDSLLTMVIMQYAFDLPGFQGNATFDTAKNAVWTAHCTAPLKMNGANGPEYPYLLRGHSEVGGSGCVPEVQYPVGQSVTRMKLINLDTILLSTAEIIEVPEKSVRACRSQIVTRVKDAAKMMFNWGGGVLEGDMMTLLHRVVFFGDHAQSVRHLAHLMKFNVIEEG